jgi:hypothetical protein
MSTAQCLYQVLQIHSRLGNRSASAALERGQSFFYFSRQRPAILLSLSAQGEARLLFFALIAGDHAVFNVNHAVRMLSNIVLVSNQDNRISLGVQVGEKGHDFAAGL